MSFIGALAARFPAMKPVADGVLKPTKSIDALGSEIMGLRFQYWYRYLSTYGETFGKAKAQSKVVMDTIKHPADITYKQLAVGAVCGVHIYGAFTIGEMLGRKSIVGYSQGKKVHHH